ncbi:four helix bundle protein [Patescibacteria group bacterium]
MSSYDLEERTAKFGEDIVKFAKKIEENLVNKRIIPQLVAAGTSVGANYTEANGASSSKDFRNKIYICKKEIQETKYWLRLVANTNSDLNDEARTLWKEAQELTLIFGKIISSLNNKNN